MKEFVEHASLFIA